MRIVWTALLSLLLLIPLEARDWVSTIAQVEKSLVRVTTYGDDEINTCGGFVINQKQGYIMTAAHCWNSEEQPRHEVVKVDGVLSFKFYENIDLDLAIIANTSGDRPALHPRRKLLKKGTPVASLGFGYGLPVSTLMVGQIAAQGPTWVLTNYPIIVGMSGGPIVDLDGKVVSINQKSDDITGIGRPLDVILGATGEFWER